MADRELLDDDGENRAVRTFLMLYGTPGLTSTKMRDHMRASGFKDHSPDWVDQAPWHLTKGGAQHWLRLLFALEKQGGDK
mgnify:CR=1 FL=1